MLKVEKSFRAAAGGLALAAVMSVASVRAADYVWTGLGDGASWSDTANWLGGTKFVSSTSNRLVFSNQVDNAVVILSGDISVNRIKFANGCKAMRLTGKSATTRIVNTWLSNALTDATADTRASIFVETTEPIIMDVVQTMSGERFVMLAQGAHLEILKPIQDSNSPSKGRVYFRTFDGSRNSYLKLAYDSTTAAIDEASEGKYLFFFVGGTNEIAAAVCATAQASPLPIAVDSGLLRLGAGAYPREIQVSGSNPVLETSGAVSLASNVTVSCSKSTLDFGAETAIAGSLKYTNSGSDSPNQTLAFGGNASITGAVTVEKSGGNYVLDLAANTCVDFNSSVAFYGAGLSQRVPATSRINYRGSVTCGQFQDDVNSEPDADHRGGEIHLYAPMTLSANFYLRGYNVVCEAANVLPANKRIIWRYEYSANCGIVDMNGFDQTTTHLDCLGTDNGSDRNIIKSVQPCTLTINDSVASTYPERVRIPVQGAISVIHNGTETQLFVNRDIDTTGDLTINSGKIQLVGTATIKKVPRITIGKDGELELAGSAATPIHGDAALYVSSEGGGLVATNASGSALTLSNRVYVDGALVTNGTYTAANATWLKGSQLTVQANYPAIWRTAADGNWTESAKWSTPPAAGKPATIDASGADYTVAITSDNASMGPLSVNNASGTATLSVGAAVSWPAWSTVTIGAGGRILVGDGGSFAYDSYTHSGENLVLATGGTLELAETGTATISTKHKDYPPILQCGGDIVAGGSSKLTLEGAMMVYLGSGKTILKDSAVLETATGKDTSGKSLNNCRLYTQSTVAGVTNHIIVRDHARIHPKNDSVVHLDQTVFGYPNNLTDKLFRLDYDSEATSFFGNQIELGATWGYAEMNVSAGLVMAGNYGIGVGGFYYDGRAATNADVVGVLNVTGGAVDISATSYADVRTRVRGLILGEGWYDKRTTTSDNLFTGHVNLSDGVISNRFGAVILGAGAAKGVWTQTGGRFENTSAQTMGPMILGWLGGEGTFILSNGTVNVASAKVATYVGGAETNLTPWVLEAQAPSSAMASKGLLSLQGGTFATAGDVIVGQDGDGTVELGAAGSLSARAMELKVAAATAEKPAHSATLKFTASAASCGRITLSDALTSSADATIELDLTAWDRTSRLRFLSCKGLSGTPISWNNVTVTGVDKSDFTNAGGMLYSFRQNANGISVGKSTGCVVIVR